MEKMEEEFMPAHEKKEPHDLDFDALIIQKANLHVVLPILTAQTAHFLSNTPCVDFKRFVYMEILIQCLNGQESIWIQPDIYFAMAKTPTGEGRDVVEPIWKELEERGFNVNRVPSNSIAVVSWMQRKLEFFFSVCIEVSKDQKHMDPQNAKKRDYAAEYARLYGKKGQVTEPQKERRDLKSVRSKDARRREKEVAAGERPALQLGER